MGKLSLEIKSTSVSTLANAAASSVNDVVLESALQDIRSGKHQTQIEQVRDAYEKGGKTAAGPLKKELPATMFSGRFSERSPTVVRFHIAVVNNSARDFWRFVNTTIII